ncbi:RluA family pseudouridine synthase [Rhodobacteraceae bacterium NNCM2]|nr:RluA family pseudouridine synthase [Coraliihabitans acroporae]
MSDPEASDPQEVALNIAVEDAGQRLDKALAKAASDLPGLSRSRIAQLIDQGALADQSGATVTDAKRKVKAGETWYLALPAPVDAEPQAEAIPLDIVHEDDDLIVVNKPAGMVVHPAPGSETGTLVNALLHHCGDSLSGIGGERRPGIVHRIDKDTSGLLVVAKTQAAHTGLAALFAAHDIDRIYRAIAWGMPDRADPRMTGLPGVSLVPDWIRIATQIARHPTDRKRMAVSKRPDHGREAITFLRSVERFGPEERPAASLIECRLETGRTHQIRVHASYLGHGLVGDAVYGRRNGAKNATDMSINGVLRSFSRQALHAAVLGFRHPISNHKLYFEAELPPDMADLLAELRRNKT